MADSPGAPDKDYSNDESLEIVLPPQINTAQWKRNPPKPAKWNEWLIPARILNEHAKLRQLSKEEWLARWKQRLEAWAEDHVKLLPKLVRLGFLEQVKDAEGRPVTRDGEPVFKASEKNRELETDEQFYAALEQAKKAERKTKYAKYADKTPNPEIIRANTAAFEQLALSWRDSLTGQVAYPDRADLRTAVLFMILTYFDSANSADLYFGDLRKAIDEKLRLDQIKHGGLKGLPKKEETGRN